jgi:predicted phosphodiesterase
MRIGVFSDVHANLEAAEVVYKAYDRLGDIDYYVCLGDVVGYGASPDRCCDLVKEKAKWTVMGNHDAAVAGRMSYEFYYPAARKAIERHNSQLSASNLEWLRGLPYTIVEGDVCFSHGSPVNPKEFDYLFNHEQVSGLIPYWEQLSRVTLIGHSHLTKSFHLTMSKKGIPQIEELEGDTLDLNGPGKYIITVGSVGQPRDNDSRACFTILDIEKRHIQFYREDYDIYQAAAAIWKDGTLMPDFGKRLFLGV